MLEDVAGGGVVVPVQIIETDVISVQAVAGLTSTKGVDAVVEATGAGAVAQPPKRIGGAQSKGGVSLSGMATVCMATKAGRRWIRSGGLIFSETTAVSSALAGI